MNLILLLIVSTTYTADLDLNYGTDGIVAMNFASHTLFRDAIVQDDQKLVVTGFTYINGSQNFLLVRILNDGALDQTFGTGGKTIVELPGNSRPNKLMQTKDGKWVTGGFSNSSNLAVVRYLADGIVDSSFGTNGVIQTKFSHDKMVGNDFRIQDDGKILATGYLERNGSGQKEMFVARFLSNGDPDVSFGANNNGLVIIDTGSFESTSNSMGLKRNGDIYIAGSTYLGTANENALIVGLSTTGEYLSDFGINGFATFDIGTHDVYRDLKIVSNGHLLVCGTTEGNGYRNGILAKISVDGTLDASFGSNGVVHINAEAFQTELCIYVHAGYIYVAGTSGQSESNNNVYFQLRRYFYNGDVDQTYGTAGQYSYDLGSEDVFRSLCRQADGKLLAPGNSRLSGNRHGTVFRFMEPESTPLDWSLWRVPLVIQDFVSDCNTINAN